MLGHFDVGRVAAIHELRGQLERRGEKAFAVVDTADRCKKCDRCRRPTKNATPPPSRTYASSAVSSSSAKRGHIEQTNGRLLVELLGIGQEARRLDVRLPTGARVAAGGEGERKLMSAAAIFASRR